MGIMNRTRNLLWLSSDRDMFSQFKGNEYLSSGINFIELEYFDSGRCFVSYKQNFQSGTYTLSFIVNVSQPRIGVKCFQSDGSIYTGPVPGFTYNQYYQAHFADPRDAYMTFTVPNTVDHFRVCFGTTSPGGNTVFKNIQLEEGTVATDYVSPYTEEKIINIPIITFKASGWGNSWNDVKDYLNTIKPGFYDIILRATLIQKKTSFDQGTNKWGIYTPTQTQDRRYTWSSSAQVGDVAEVRSNLRVTSTPFSNFYVYGCGRDGLGDTGKADIEITIINPYTEEII